MILNRVCKNHVNSVHFIANHLPVLNGASGTLIVRQSHRSLKQSSDILIVGGGIIGLSTAYWIKQKNPKTSITVIERDPQYRICSTTRSVGGIRSHFSLPENIKLSMFSFDFLSNIDKYLKVDTVGDDDDLDIGLVQNGYLFLASEKGRNILLANHEIQKECGASIEILNSSQLKTRYPWLNTDGIVLGSLGVDKEGWFDPYRLLMAFRKKILSLGVNYIHGNLIDFIKNCTGNRQIVIGASVQLSNGNIEKFDCQQIILTTGPQSGELSRKLSSELDKPFICPVNPRKRYVYSFKCNSLSGYDFPMLIDPSGIYFRGEGSCFITGLSPDEANEPDPSNLDDVDYNFFDNHIWPRLAERVKAFESIKVSSGWSGFYDFNELDENAIIDRDPNWSNVIWATGFSGHGIQMGPGAGRAVSELVLDGKFTTIDCSRFGIQRVFEGRKLLETNII